MSLQNENSCSSIEELKKLAQTSTVQLENSCSSIEELKKLAQTSTVQLTYVQFKELCESILSGSNARRSFIGCSLRFKGTETRQQIEKFINSIELYKVMGNISDSDALLTFPLLLSDVAMKWWQGINGDIKTWSEAIKILRNKYAPELPPHEIYMEMFSGPQSDDEPITEFLDRQRALLAQLPANRHDENHQLDLIYGLLSIYLREKIMREDITSFEGLIQKARHYESIRAERMSTLLPNKIKQTRLVNGSQ